MKVRVKLALRTREVYQLFQRRMSGERLFIAVILHRFNNIMAGCQQDNSQLLLKREMIEQALISLTQQFDQDRQRFAELIQRKERWTHQPVELVAQFFPDVTVSNHLGVLLVEYLDAYDHLIATLKLLGVMHCFSTKQDYYFNIKYYQRLSNKLLGGIVG